MSLRDLLYLSITTFLDMLGRVLYLRYIIWLGSSHGFAGTQNTEFFWGYTARNLCIKDYSLLAPHFLFLWLTPYVTMLISGNTVHFLAFVSPKNFRASKCFGLRYSGRRSNLVLQVIYCKELIFIGILSTAHNLLCTIRLLHIWLLHTMMNIYGICRANGVELVFPNIDLLHSGWLVYLCFSIEELYEGTPERAKDLYVK